MEKSRYLIKTWNGKYGNGARFIVFDTKEEKYAEFAPTRPNDLAWVAKDLTKVDEYKNFQSFEDEPVDDLKSIVF